MKLLSNYIKEMKIAARGFYFYIEIVIAVIIVSILLFAISEESVSREKEFLFYEAEQELYDYIMDPYFKDGRLVRKESVGFKVKAMDIEVVDQETGEIISHHFDENTIAAETIEQYDTKTGKLDKTIYKVNSYEDMLHLSYSEQSFGAVVKYELDENYKIIDSYKYYIQGYETERFMNILYVLYNENPEVLKEYSDKQNVRVLGDMEKLNNRESMVPIFLTFLGSIMGIVIVVAYLFLDKNERVIKSFAVTPASINSYLFSKIMVILTTVTISSVIITIPVMGTKPDYLQLLLFLYMSTFAMSAIGLFLSSFFDNMTNAFGALFGVVLILLLPMFSYFIPSFDPLWLRFFPTYSMLQGYKTILLGGIELRYVLLYSFIYLIGGIIIFALANVRLRKTLTV